MNKDSRVTEAVGASLPSGRGLGLSSSLQGKVRANCAGGHGQRKETELWCLWHSEAASCSSDLLPAQGPYSPFPSSAKHPVCFIELF